MKAGFARVDITPPLGTFISGYYQDRFAKTVLDPLEVNMLAFADGENRALIAQIDTQIARAVIPVFQDAAGN